MMEPIGEPHLFLIYKDGLKQADRILEEIKQEFIVLNVHDIIWDRQNNFKNLCRFYTNCKPIIFWKYLRCGGAPLRVILVLDQTPEYMDRVTNAGTEKVNVHMFDSKKKYRKMMKNGHLVHGSNSQFEFFFNYTMLFGKTPDLTYLKQLPQWDGKITRLNVNMPGTHGWKNLAELLQIIEQTGNSIVLRNFENLPDSCRLGKHSDIDILTSAPDELVRMLNLKRASSLPFRAIWKTDVAESFVKFDIRSADDGYYPPEIVAHLLENKVVNEKKIPVPAGKDYFYSLLYHALIHKYKVADDYKKRLTAMAVQLGCISHQDSDELPEASLKDILVAWMNENSFCFCEPKDLTVHYNKKYTGSVPTSKLRAVKDFFWRFRKG